MKNFDFGYFECQVVEFMPPSVQKDLGVGSIYRKSGILLETGDQIRVSTDENSPLKVYKVASVVTKTTRSENLVIVYVTEVN